MNIEDKDINKLLKDFEGEDIILPDELDIRLSNKLKELKPKKYRKILVSAIASILIFIFSYSVIPNFKTFADQVFRYIFGDIGVENAVNNGYKNIPSKNINISGYDIYITNIYMDSLRVSFDATISNIDNGKIDEYGQPLNQYSLYVDAGLLGSVSVSNGLSSNMKNSQLNVQIIGEGISKIYEMRKDKLELKLDLVVKKNILKDGQYELVEEKLGSKQLSMDIPKYIYDNKLISINKYISDTNLDLHIKKLDVSPTMMYLDTEGNFTGNSKYHGLYNFRIISEEGDLYKESLTLSAIGDEENYRQTIVPSVYYDNSKKLRLKADGVLIRPKEKIDIKLNDKYPKTIEYYGDKLVIHNVYYENNKLTVEILGNDNIENFAMEGSIDEFNSIGGGMHENIDEESVHYIQFDIDKRESYSMNLEIMMKYKMPIDIDIDYNK